MAFTIQTSDSVAKKLKEELKLSNPLMVPRVKSISLNISSGEAQHNDKLRKTIEDTLARITGQKAVAVKAKKSISNFKIRKGMTVGWRVTLRGKHMRDFLTKLIHVTLPRVRDFRGLSRSGFDGQGNYTIGFSEHIVFPEIRADEVETIHGLEVSINTTARDNKTGYRLLHALGFPFND